MISPPVMMYCQKELTFSRSHWSLIMTYLRTLVLLIVPDDTLISFSFTGIVKTTFTVSDDPVGLAARVWLST